MTAPNERERRLSAVGEGRIGLEDLGEAERQRAEGEGEEAGDEHREPGAAVAGSGTKALKAPEDNQGDDGGHRREGDERSGGPVQEFPDTHDLESSAFLSLLTTICFLLLTIAMSGQLPAGTYLVMAGLAYVSLFVFGFLLGRQDPAPDGDRVWVQVVLGGRWMVLLIMGGFMLHGMVGSGEVRSAWWEPPVLWVPAVLLPAIAVGGALDGELLGEIARGLSRRTPWHALRFILSERRRAAAGRRQQEAKS